MHNNRQRQLTRFVALTLVTGGHILLLLLLFKSKSIDVRTHAQAPGTLILSESPRPQQVRVTSRLTLPSAADRSIDKRPPELPPIADDIRGSPIDAPVSPETNWQLEAQRSVEAMAPGWLEEQKRKCETLEGRSTPPECRQRKYEFGWSPEPGRVGMSGLLPYVRLGQRCVIGLGFFGCAIGELPEPNGDLFEHMRDPDRPRSSVPDVPEAGM